MKSKPKQKSKLSSLEIQLSELLLLFDRNNKEDVAQQLVKIFKIEKDGDWYPLQIERLLKRKLTENETFKVSVLDSVLNINNGGGIYDGEG